MLFISCGFYFTSGSLPFRDFKFLGFHFPFSFPIRHCLKISLNVYDVMKLSSKMCSYVPIKTIDDVINFKI